jgi:5'-3' exonuclease
LLRQFSTLEEVLLAAPQIPGTKGKALLDGAEVARLSRKLTALRADVVFPHLQKARTPLQ